MGEHYKLTGEDRSALQSIDCQATRNYTRDRTVYTKRMPFGPMAFLPRACGSHVIVISDRSQAGGDAIVNELYGLIGTNYIG
jgi:hypothetical protein